MKKHVFNWTAFILENKIDVLLAVLKRKSLFFFLQDGFHGGCEEYPHFK